MLSKLKTLAVATLLASAALTGVQVAEAAEACRMPQAVTQTVDANGKIVMKGPSAEFYACNQINIWSAKLAEFSESSAVLAGLNRSGPMGTEFLAKMLKTGMSQVMATRGVERDVALAALTDALIVGAARGERPLPPDEIAEIIKSSR